MVAVLRCVIQRQVAPHTTFDGRRRHTLLTSRRRHRQLTMTQTLWAQSTSWHRTLTAATATVPRIPEVARRPASQAATAVATEPPSTDNRFNTRQSPGNNARNDLELLFLTHRQILPALCHANSINCAHWTEQGAPYLRPKRLMSDAECGCYLVVIVFEFDDFYRLKTTIFIVPDLYHINSI